MDCTSNNSAIFQQDDSDNVNVNVDGYGGVNDDVERMSKTTTSGSNPRGDGKRDDDDDDVHMSNNNSSNEDVAATTMQPSSLTAIMIVKGKRTRRQRLHSPVTYSNATNNEEDADQDAAEQLDVANCLILLAQGQSPSIGRNELGLLTKLSSSDRTRRSSSQNRRGNGSSMYECKTCNRTFPSFQALGGHRASHKKLKITVVHHDFTPVRHSASDSLTPLVMPPSLSPLSLQLGNISYSRAPPAHSNRSGNKVHECSICGAEFSSGQALGGHMRRHRGPLIPLNSSTTNSNHNPIANTTLSLMSTAIAVESVDTALAAGEVNRINTSNNNGSLSLDLNLPASPSPDDIKFSLGPKQHQSQQRQRQSTMAFSTPALVDCFY